MSTHAKETRQKENGCNPLLLTGVGMFAAGIICAYGAGDKISSIWNRLTDGSDDDRNTTDVAEAELTRPDGEVILFSDLPENIWQLPDFPDAPVDEQPSLSANSEFAMGSQDRVLSLFDYYTDLAEKYGLEILLGYVPSYRVNLPFSADQTVILGINRGEKNDSEEGLLSLNYGPMYADPETRTALENGATWFHENVLAVEGNGADKTVAFQAEPADLALSDLFVQAPEGSGDNYFRTPEIVVEGTQELTYTMYAFFVGAVQKYEEQSGVDFTDAQVQRIAARLLNEWFKKNTVVKGGYYPAQFLNANGEVVNLLDTNDVVYFFNTPWEIRRGQMQPDEDDARDGQEYGYQCVVIHELPEGEETDFAQELDAVNAMYTVSMVVDLESMPELADGDVEEAVAALYDLIAILPMHRQDVDGFENPASYEKTDPNGKNGEDFPWVLDCEPGTPDQVVPRSTPIAPLSTPQGTPPSESKTPTPSDTPDRTPTPSETPDQKSPNEDPVGDGGYTNPEGGSIIDRNDPVDTIVGTPEPLPTASAAEATPPSLEQEGF